MRSLAVMMPILGGLVLLGTACSSETSLSDSDRAAVTKLGEGGNMFAADLYARLAARPGNVFFSPASIDSALAMTYAGAAGPTAGQMASTLHFTLPAEKLHHAFAALAGDLNHPPGNWLGQPAYQFTVANALWGQQGCDFKPTFLGLLRDTYKASLNEVDFNQAEAARKAINDWVAKETHGRIQDLAPAGVLTNDTRLVLTNAIYFKGHWATQFEKSATRDEPFRLSPDKMVQTRMMHLQHSFGYAETPDVQVLSMPYKANRLDMVVLLPKKPDGLAELEKSLTGEKLAGLLSAAKSRDVLVTLPKFTFASEFDLSGTLKAMGMTDAFDRQKASFPGITAKERLFVSDVLHKAFVAVDEEGTEAAAATGIIAWGRGLKEEVPAFKAEHPFIFLIRHSPTNTILFMGRVVDPK
jgi:serpin B